MMSEEELAKLAGDIKKNGLVHRVVMYEGVIVDGRNRYVACRMAGVEPQTVEWRKTYKGPMSLLDWIASENVQRRHLTSGQIAMIYTKLYGLKESEDARRRQIEAARQQGQHGRKGGRTSKEPSPANSSEGVPASEAVAEAKPQTNRDRSGETRRTLAQKAGVSEHQMQQAFNVEKADPKLADAVAKGAVPLRDANKEVKARGKEETPNGESAGPKKPRKTVSVADAVNDIARRVDALLDGVDDDYRKKFVAELIEMLKGRKK